jgi:CBS domain-containing protein
MTPGIVRCSPSASLREVAALMTERRIHCVVVADERDESSMWGVISDLDLVAAATVRPVEEQAAGGSALRPAATIGGHESLADAARRMTRQGVSHLVVVDPVQRRPLGVVSTLDVAGALADVGDLL